MRLPKARYPRLLMNLSTNPALDLGKRETLGLTEVCYPVPGKKLPSGCQQEEPHFLASFLLMLCKQGSRRFGNCLYIYKSNTVMGKTNKHSLVEKPAMKYHWLYNNLLQLFFLFTLDRKCFHLTHGIRIYTTKIWLLYKKENFVRTITWGLKQ